MAFAIVAALVAVFGILGQVIAQDAPFSSFYLSGIGTQFAVNLPNDSTDVNFRFASPAFSWVAVGTGDKMAGSLMLVMYYSADRKSVTVSPRIATGHSEPSFTDAVKVVVIESSIQNDSFVVTGVCRGCRSWPGGSLDLSSRSQPWIFAYGPDLDIASDSLTLGLRRHDHYGHFTMDMVQAQGANGIPPLTNVRSGTSIAGQLTKDSDKSNYAHSILIIFAILVALPLKVTVSSLRPGSKMNILTAGFFLMLVLAGFGVGIYMSLLYNRTKKFNTPHQIIGLIVMASFLILFVQGLVTRTREKKSENQVNNDPYIQAALKPTSPNLLVANIHIWFGRFAWVLAIVNGGLGLHVAMASTRTKILYVVVTLGIGLAMATVYVCILYRRRQKRREGRRGSDTEIELQNYWAGNK